MGIDVHGLNLIRFAKKNKPLGRVATLGRQSLSLNHHQCRQILNLPFFYNISDYCEMLLTDVLQAECVDSFDASDYENCTFVEDFNKPLSKKYQCYDTLFDGGSLEHIFNTAQALDNISKLCCIGGQILHIVPANKLNGHGFYQFNSELFYSYYSNANGYSDTICMYADFNHDWIENKFYNDKFWYLAKPVTGIERNMFNPEFPTYLLCRTVKTTDVANKTVQASDYKSWWGWTQNISPEGPQIVEIAVEDLLK